MRFVELADGLERLSHYDFPTELNGVTRAYFEAESKILSGQTAADMRVDLKRVHEASPGWSASRRWLCR